MPTEITGRQIKDSTITPAKLALASNGGLEDGGARALQVQVADNGGVSRTADGLTASPLVHATTTDSSSIANTTTETSYGQTYAIPADWFAAGKVVRVTAAGYYSTSGTPNLRNRLTIAGQSLVGPNFTTANNAANLRWRLQCDIVCRTTGASGTVLANGLALLQDASADAAISPAGLVSTLTVDTTGALTLDVTAQWSAADPANTTVMTSLVVELLN